MQGSGGGGGGVGVECSATKTEVQKFFHKEKYLGLHTNFSASVS